MHAYNCQIIFRESLFLHLFWLNANASRLSPITACSLNTICESISQSSNPMMIITNETKKFSILNRLMVNKRKICMHSAKLYFYIFWFVRNATKMYIVRERSNWLFIGSSDSSSQWLRIQFISDLTCIWLFDWHHRAIARFSSRNCKPVVFNISIRCSLSASASETFNFFRFSIHIRTNRPIHIKWIWMWMISSFVMWTQVAVSMSKSHIWRTTFASCK